MKQTCSSEDAVHSHISFVTRDDKFSQENPYILRFSPADGFPSQNVATHTAELSLVDIRSQPPMRYDECGIKVLELDTSMQRQDFESKDTIRDVYLPLLQDAVKTSLGAKNVKVIPHIVELPEPHYATYKIRRQPTGFPRSTGESLEDEVPATVAHIDATRVELQRAIASCDVGHVPEECRVEWVNTWAPLQGPVRQWPLGVCDSSSFDAQHDSEDTDLVYNNTMHREFVSVHARSGQRWYYLSKQMPHEHILFRQASLYAGEHETGVPHASFPISQCNGHVRESIEVKLLVLY